MDSTPVMSFARTNQFFITSMGSVRSQEGSSFLPVHSYALS